MSTVVSFLWPKNGEVLRQYLSRVPSKVYDVQSLLSLVDGETRATIASEAKSRTERVAEQIAGHVWSGAVLAQLDGKLQQMMQLIAALDAAHKTDPIEVIVLNEDVTQQEKTAASWAKANSVPCVVLSHSCILGRLYTVHRESNGNRMAVFGSRGAQPYLETGIDAARLTVTGNPAWDKYPQLVPLRSQIRAQIAERFGIRENEHLVVFATTWPAFLTAFCDPAHYEVSLRAVLRSVRELRALNVPIRLVIKERPSNAQRASERDAIIREEAIGYDPIVVQEDLEKWLVAADAAISVDSNVSLEAILADTVPINLWTPMSWLNGPFFGAEDGVLDSAPDKLSIALAHALGDPGLSEHLRADARARLAEFTAHVGTAGSKAADLLVAIRKQSVPKTVRYVWEELSTPRSVNEKGVDSVYYRSPRLDMIAHVRGEPKLMLDVGCGAGATGAEIKRRFPQSFVSGIELNREAAAMAEGRIDRIICGNVETLDFAEHDFAQRSVDLVFFPDVLEHLYDPWRLLARLKPFLSPNAQIIASIPNVRNLWLLLQLIGGDWPYAEDGLLDVTHIRFFTKKTVIELFEQTGYNVRAIYANVDGRVPAMQAAAGATVNIDTSQLTLKNMSQEDLVQLRTLQFIVDATPAG